MLNNWYIWFNKLPVYWMAYPGLFWLLLHRWRVRTNSQMGQFCTLRCTNNQVKKIVNKFWLKLILPGPTDAPPSPPAPSMPLSTPQTPQGIPGIPGMLDASQSVRRTFDFSFTWKYWSWNNVKHTGADKGCSEGLVRTNRRQNRLNSPVCRTQKGLN